MLNEKMQDAINKQINAELFSSYLYLSMNAWFESMNLKGFSNWMKVQAQEEADHAMRFYDYVINRGGRVKLSKVDGPPMEWKSPLDAFEAVYKHEQKVTGMINDLVNLSIEEKDHASNTMLQWFVNEQVEEEANASDIIGKLKLIGKEGSGIFMLDRELATRVYVPPVKGNANANANTPA